MSDSNLQWTEEAEERVARVPEGFMRTMTKKRIEEFAADKSLQSITLDTVEEVIGSSRAGMGSMMGGDMSGMGMKMPHSLKPETENQEVEVYYFCFVCNYAVPGKIPNKCPNCDSDSEKFSLLEPQYRTPAHTMILAWTSNANKYLDSIPDGFRRKMAKNEIEAFSRRNGYKVVTGDVVDERLEKWGDVSKKMVSEMEWDEGVLERVNRIPGSIRGMVIREMEVFAKKEGEGTVTGKTLEAIRKKWAGTKEFHVKWQ